MKNTPAEAGSGSVMGICKLGGLAAGAAAFGGPLPVIWENTIDVHNPVCIQTWQKTAGKSRRSF